MGRWTAAVGDWLGAKKRCLKQILVLTILGAILILSNLFVGVTEWSQVIVNGAAKHFYDTSKQNETTVLLFTETDLAKLGSFYPPPWQLHADVLSALATYHPAIVVIDFAFVDRRAQEEVSALADSICTLTESGTTVLMVVNPVQTGRTLLMPELERCAKPVSASIGPDEGQAGTLTYPATECYPDGKCLPTAAFAAFENYSAYAPNGNAGTPGNTEDMEIVWANGNASLNTRWMDCGRPSLGAALPSLLAGQPLAMKRRCPYTRTIFVADLLGNTGDQDLVDAFQRRVVFYGGAFTLAGDFARSPVYEDLPAVYVHAMAFDNLVTFGSGYKRASQTGVAYVTLDLFLLVFIASLLTFFRRGQWGPGPDQAFRDSEERNRVERYLMMVKRWTIFGVAAGIVVFSAAFILDLDELLVVSMSLYFLARVFVLEDRAYAGIFLASGFVAVLSFFVLNLGPRNFLAFMIFAELVRFLQKRLARLSGEWLDAFEEWKTTSGIRKLLLWLPWFVLDTFSEAGCVKSPDRQALVAGSLGGGRPGWRDGDPSSRADANGRDSSPGVGRCRRRGHRPTDAGRSG